MSVALDLPALAAWMRVEGIEVAGDLTATRVGRGQSNLTYRLSDERKRSWIARRPPLGELLASAHDVVREHRILAALQDTEVPVPSLVGVCEDAAVADVPVVVMEHVDGIVLDRMDIAESLDPDVRRELGLNLARTLAHIHAVDVDAVGLGDLASRSPYAERQLRRWSRQFEASRTTDRPDLDALTALLQAHVPPPGDLSLVHGDFHIRNVIADGSTGSLRAVLDWELSTLGDPLADIGSTLAYWPEAGESASGLFEASTLPGFPTRTELADEYLATSGRDGDTLAFWHVLGVWKIAIISEGVYRRTLDNPENTAEGGAPTPQRIQAVIDHAWDIAAAHGMTR
ncbi:phosphotransferase family protein [Aeromicrobium phragmitis]|uniref:Phosphotransferase family protein n=1 Tax=Aeromicrobium phragmitis TaxID=2478914 RepID=A0A3L8PKU0_9ACTN|nr:phosphotransferase family protein [Aeromicrobium phragmitis]RLV55333.1 phosphotransferase family protein [Aeromicrobium phragmitis]